MVPPRDRLPSLNYRLLADFDPSRNPQLAARTFSTRVGMGPSSPSATPRSISPPNKQPIWKRPSVSTR
jgi:hypothetical protein